MSEESVLLGELAEEFTARVRAGQLPEVEDYARRHPDLAGRIRELFPALLFLEGMAGGTPKSAEWPCGGELVSGSTFGAYRIEREVGRGGMGVVYEAVHLALHKRVALKVLPVSGAGAAGQLERFLREARTAAGLHHTNIVPVFDVGQAAGVPYYAMQFIDGKGLDRVLGEGLADPTVPYTPGSAAPLPAPSPHPAATPRPDYFRWVAGLGIQAAEGLAHAHQRGVVHRDVKPSNLLLDAQGVLWITDFGLARRLEDPALTHSGVLLGTPRYMSPEQAEAASKPIDHRTDIYSLGATLYELLTRRPAFDGRTPQEVVSQIVSREPVAPRRLDRAIPRDLETIVLKAMAKRPQDRYQAAQELADDLGRWLRTEPIRARRIGVIGRVSRWCRRNPRLAVVTASAAALLLLVSSLYHASLLRTLGREQETRSQAEASAREARRRLTRHYVDNGVRVMDDGDLLGSLPWFAEALWQDRDDPERARVHRARLNAVLQRCPKLVHVWSHDNAVSAVAFRPDGAVVLTGGFDNTARTWDAVTGQSLLSLPHPGLVLRTMFSADGQRVVTVSSATDQRGGYEVRVWEAATGRLIGRPLRHDGHGPSLVTLSPDGRRLFTVETSSGEGPTRPRLHLHDATTAGHVAALEGEYQGALEATFSLDGRRLLVTAGGDGFSGNAVRVFDAATGRALTPPLTDLEAHSAGFSGDGRRLFVVTEKTAFRVYEADTGRPVGPKLDRVGPVRQVALSPDGRRALVLTAEGPGPWEARAWDVVRGRPLGPSLQQPMGAMRVSFDGRQAVTTDHAVMRRSWSQDYPQGLQMGAQGPVLGNWRWEAAALVFSPDGRLVFAPGPGGTGQVWDRIAGKPVSPPLRHGSDVKAAAFSPDSGRLVTAASDGKVRLWDLAPGLPAVGNLQLDGIFSPDGRRVLLAAPEGYRIWDVVEGKGPPGAPVLNYDRNTRFGPGGEGVLFTSKQGGAELACAGGWVRLLEEDFRDEPPDVSFSAGGRHVLTVQGKGTDKTEVRVWDTATGRPAGPPLRPGGTGCGAVLSPDGSRALTVSRVPAPDERFTARLWDVAGGEPIGPERPVEGTPSWGTWFTPDGGRVFLATQEDGQDRTLYCFDGRTFEPLPAPEALGRGASLLAASPDGKRVLLTSGGQVRVWDTATFMHRSEPLADYRSEGLFSPDGRRVAAVSEDGDRARVWDAESGAPVTPPLRHGEPIHFIRFSGDSSLVLTRGTGRARVWDAGTGEPLTPPDWPFTAFGEGRRALAVLNGEIRGWDLEGDDRPPEDYLRLAQALAGGRIDETGGHVPVDGPTYRAGWAALREAGHKQDSSSPQWAKNLWRWGAAVECVRAGEWAGALVHLDHCAPADRDGAQGQVYRGDALRGLRRWDEAVTAYTKAIERGSKDWAAWFGRGEARAELGRWVEAAEDFGKAQAAGASATECDYRQALALLSAGKRPDYRRLCERLMPGEAAHAEGSNVLRAWLYVLAADAVIDLTAIVNLAEKGAQGNPHHPVAVTALEAALYRAGHHEDPRWGRSEVTPPGRFFRVMHLHRQGKTGEARQALVEAAREAADVEADGATEWMERAELRLLRAEAEALVNPPKP